jgi:hypothetical protein
MPESHPEIASYFVVNPNDQYYGHECKLEPQTTDERREGRMIAKFADGEQATYINSQHSGRLPDIAHLGLAKHGIKHVAERLQTVRDDIMPLYTESAPTDWSIYFNIMSKVLDTNPPEINQEQER